MDGISVVMIDDEHKDLPEDGRELQDSKWWQDNVHHRNPLQVRGTLLPADRMGVCCTESTQRRRAVPLEQCTINTSVRSL